MGTGTRQRFLKPWGLAMVWLWACTSPLHALELSPKEQAFLSERDSIVFVSQTRYPPFEFTDKNGQHEGMMRDVVRWLAVEIGFRPAFTDATFAEAQQAVLKGKADVLTSLFYSDKRSEKFEFTSTLFEVPASIFVKAERTDIKDVRDLNGKIIAIQRGDYARDFLESKQIVFSTLDTHDFAEAADMVIAGKADAVIGDEQIVLYHIFQNRLTDKIKKVGEPLYTGKNCMAASKGNAVLSAILNKGIEHARRAGILDKVSKKWLGTLYGPRVSWLERYLWPAAVLVGGIGLLSLWVWGWNVRLRTMVRRNTEEIRRSQDALRESEARYRELFENASDIIYTHDLLGNYTSVNDAARRILGYTTEELLSLNVRDISDPEHLAVIEESVRAQIRDGDEGSGPHEILVRDKLGTPMWFEINSRIIYDQGKPMGVHGTARDITARKRAEEALNASREEYRLAVENAHEAIFVAQDGAVKFNNSRTMELLGYTDTELAAMRFEHFIHPEDRLMVLDDHARRVAGDAPPSTNPFRVIDKSGQLKWVELNAVLVNWDGRPAVLCFLVDITVKRRMEEELVKVQKLESLGVLAGGIAHDFNNSLTAILGNISLAMIRLDKPEEARQSLTSAEKACVHAKTLTQQLLTFSKGGAPLRHITSVAQLVQDTCAFALRGSHARCACAIPDDLWTVDVDEGQISQVINNLMINADYAMPRGGLVHVQAENVTIGPEHGLPLTGGPYVRVAVKDEGIGIPPDILPRVFDPYFTTKTEGSGLGLATSYSIIRNHQGFITVESEQGRGTTFHVYLPASQGSIESPAGLDKALPLGRGRILVMDDKESVRCLARDALTLLGYEVETAEDGAQAIDCYRQAVRSGRSFQVVILDLTVPGGMGGVETMARLREIDPRVTAVVSSGYSNDPIMSDFRRYGFRAVVAKPYTVQELGAALAALVENTADGQNPKT
ncbi:MAG: PAS domain S-box protein [Thermodesulfobacteriota bacterium]